MLSYSPIDPEEDSTSGVPCPSVPVTQPPVIKKGNNRTEVDYVVLAFVVGTLIIIVSDMIGKK